MNDVEGLKIYKKYLDMIYYMEMISKKFPLNERNGLVEKLQKVTYNGMQKIIEANKEFDKRKRVVILNQLDVDLKMIKVLVRVAYKNKYINKQNYKAWSFKMTGINNLLLGWIKSCLKQ